MVTPETASSLLLRDAEAVSARFPDLKKFFPFPPLIGFSQPFSAVGFCCAFADEAARGGMRVCADRLEPCIAASIYRNAGQAIADCDKTETGEKGGPR